MEEPWVESIAYPILMCVEKLLSRLALLPTAPSLFKIFFNIEAQYGLSPRLQGVLRSHRGS